MMHQCPIGIKLLCPSWKVSSWVSWHDDGTSAVILLEQKGVGSLSCRAGMQPDVTVYGF